MGGLTMRARTLARTSLSNPDFFYLTSAGLKTDNLMNPLREFFCLCPSPIPYSNLHTQGENKGVMVRVGGEGAG